MFSGAPDPDKIISATRTTTGNIAVIPAGHWFTFDVVLSASVSVTGSSAPTVSLSGAGGAPADGTVMLRLNVNGLSLTTVCDSIRTEIVGFADTDDLTLVFTAGASGTSSVSLNGYYY